MRRFEGVVGNAVGSVRTKVFPAIVSEAFLVSDVVLEAAVSLTVPEPVPVAPVIVIHDALFVVDQVHPADVVTVTLTLPPVAATDLLVGEIVNAQEPA
jgi:hypothetical protein